MGGHRLPKPSTLGPSPASRTCQNGVIHEAPQRHLDRAPGERKWARAPGAHKDTLCVDTHMAPSSLAGAELGGRQLLALGPPDRSAAARAHQHTEGP